MPTLAVYLHTIDPYAIMLWEGGPIRWYGLSYLLGFFIAFLLMRRVVTVGVSPLKREMIGDLVVALALGVVIGGRVGYCVFYQPRLLGFIDHFPYWGVLAMNEGGMASHGGMIGGMIAAGWYAHRYKIPLPHLLDLLAFAAPLGLFFGRIANFINGELYGRPVSPGSIAMRWAVRFPQEMLTWSPDSPVDEPKVREVSNVIHLLPEVQAGGYFESWDQVAVSAVRAIQNHNIDVIRIAEPVLTPRHPSQIYQALLEGLLLFMVLLWLWRKPQKPLVIGGAFFVVYGIARIVGEMFRNPDAIIIHQEFERFGVTRGQLLSALLPIAGVVMILAARRRNTQPLGGWR